MYVPSPIFCLGPHSTGKTSIVCDVIEVLQKQKQETVNRKKIRTTTASTSSTIPQYLQQQQQSVLKSAYVDCSILEPSSIERLVYMVYQQLRPTTISAISSNKKQKKKKRKRKNIGKSSINNKRRKLSLDEQESQVKYVEKNDATIAATVDENKVNDSVQEDDDSISRRRRVLPSREVKNTTTTTMNDPRKMIYQSQEPQSSNENNATTTEKVETSHSAVVSLGRSLQVYYGHSATIQRIGILILDNADELLSLSSAAKKSKKRRRNRTTTPHNNQLSSSTANNRITNFLAELLLLPKIMKLNLTVIVLSTYATLDKTRKLLFVVLSLSKLDETILIASVEDDTHRLVVVCSFALRSE